MTKSLSGVVKLHHDTPSTSREAEGAASCTPGRPPGKTTTRSNAVQKKRTRDEDAPTICPPLVTLPSPSSRTSTQLDPSGWPLDPRERFDFYHRVRSYPEDVATWRKAFTRRALEDRELFPAVPAGATLDEVRQRIDDGIDFLREVARILALLHGTPDLGNKPDPVDELVYIILARKTPEPEYQRAFDELKARFQSWDLLLRAPRSSVSKMVHSGGLSGKKTDTIFAALEVLRNTFGSCTLEPARDWPDDRLEAFLCSLPELGRKSAYCVMMYSFGRQVFPVDAHVGTVLARVSPYRELGFSLEGLDHKKLQAILADLIPPVLRHSLHVNLLVHGREICRAVQPLCQHCELRNFCAFFRRSEAARVEQSNAPTVVDLFAGAGGSSEGFTRAGFRSILALDQSPLACRTYWLNHPALPDDRILCRDIRTLQPGDLRKLLGDRKVDVLVGSPPCQGFSHIGSRSQPKRIDYRVHEHSQNFLFEYMVAAAIELQPSLFLMENVPGMQSARREKLSYLETAAHQLQKTGKFKTAIWCLNASAFGVPQDRVRYVLVASRLGALPAPPHEEYQDTRRPDFDVDALDPVTFDEAVFDLPPREANSGHVAEVWQPTDPVANPRCRRYLGKFRLLTGSPILYNHTVRYNNEQDLELYALLRPGEDSIHALERHGRTDLMRYRKDVFDDKYARLRPDRPSKTIVAHLAKDGNGYIHPSQVRSISVREAARLQSFHDGYVFCGSPSDQWVQVGNAVPPLLAESIARSFMRLLKR